MSTLEELIAGGEHVWIGALPPYQAEHISALLKQGLSPEQVAIAWLTVQGPANTFPFGGDSNRSLRSLFYERLLREVEDYICGAERYGADRAKLLGELKPTHAYLISTISVAVSPALGAAAPLIAPAIAMILYTTARIGIKAWCAARKDIRESNVPLT